MESWFQEFFLTRMRNKSWKHFLKGKRVYLQSKTKMSKWQRDWDSNAFSIVWRGRQKQLEMVMLWRGCRTLDEWYGLPLQQWDFGAAKESGWSGLIGVWFFSFLNSVCQRAGRWKIAEGSECEENNRGTQRIQRKSRERYGLEDWTQWGAETTKIKPEKHREQETSSGTKVM